jgi:uncharacterized membrane protein AbrB (regulator of aidB expression)
VNWLARLLFPYSPHFERRRQLRVLFVSLLIGLLAGALLAAGLYWLATNPIHR